MKKLFIGLTTAIFFMFLPVTGGVCGSTENEVLLKKDREIAKAAARKGILPAFFPFMLQHTVLFPEYGHPVRGILRHYDNVNFVLAEVTAVDPAARTITANGRDVPYDYLLLSAGSTTRYFGVPGAADYSFSLKSMEEGVFLRNHILACFERAVQTRDPERRRGFGNRRR